MPASRFSLGALTRSGVCLQQNANPAIWHLVRDPTTEGPDPCRHLVVERFIAADPLDQLARGRLGESDVTCRFEGHSGCSPRTSDRRQNILNRVETSRWR